MNILFYFIFGILFVDLILPLLESIFSVIATKLEVYKAKYNVQINDYNLIIDKGDISPIVNPIGFATNDDLEVEEIIDE